MKIRKRFPVLVSPITAAPFGTLAMTGPSTSLIST
jgi:hypothetical protein